MLRRGGVERCNSASVKADPRYGGHAVRKDAKQGRRRPLSAVSKAKNLRQLQCELQPGSSTNRIYGRGVRYRHIQW